MTAEGTFHWFRRAVLTGLCRLDRLADDEKVMTDLVCAVAVVASVQYQLTPSEWPTHPPHPSVKTPPTEETPKVEEVKKEDTPTSEEASKKSFFATMCGCFGGKTPPAAAEGDATKPAAAAEETAKEEEKPAEEETPAAET